MDMDDMSQHQRLYRLNYALHKQGKHACTECLTVLDWTPDNFNYVNTAQGRLHGECRNCERVLMEARPSGLTRAQKARRFAQVLEVRP